MFKNACDIVVARKGDSRTVCEAFNSGVPKQVI